VSLKENRGWKNAGRRLWRSLNKLPACCGGNFGATKIYLFGSTLRLKGFHSHSDIDLAVDGIDPKRYFSAVGQALMMSDEFSVDLLEISACRPELKEIILKEGRML
jgi:predicted nucleotidyltransferase